MITAKYSGLGFEISKFGANSLALRFEGKPVFIFSADAEIDAEFVTLICDFYLNTHPLQKQPAAVRA